MKIHLSFVALALSCSVIPAVADQKIIDNGAPLARIYVPPTPPTVTNSRKPVPDAALVAAVRELNYHLQKMSGTSLEVVYTSDEKQVKAPAIVLGDLAIKLGAVPQKTSESKEGFRLLTKNGLVLIGGESDEGTLFGVDELLEKLGCDWVMPGEIGEIIPQQKTVSIPDLDESSAPDFLIRRLWYRGYPQPRKPEEFARFEEWSRRQKAGRYDSIAGQTAGHYWTAFVNKHKAEFDADPNLYALRRSSDGSLVRKGPQIETTNPKNVDMMVQDIKDAYAKNGWPKDKPAGFPIGPADGLGYSLSSEALAVNSGKIDPIVGEADRTDEMVLLANRIFEKLGDEYPHVYLGYYSYSVHGDFPMRYKPNPRLVQIFAPINFSRFHSFLDANSKTQTYYKSVVDQWGKLAKEQGNLLLFRGFNWNLAENMLPYSKIRTWGLELPYYKKMGFLGANIEATKAWSVNGPSDWVFMKLAWDSSQDWHTLLRDYCTKAFGNGARPMEAYFLRLTETQRASGLEAGSYWSFPLAYDDAFIKAAQDDFAQAKNLAQSEAEKTRIGYFADSVEALRLYLEYFRATQRFDFTAAKSGYDAMKAHWQKQYDGNSDVVANEVPSYLKRYIETFVNQSVQYSSGDYRIVEKLPDEMPTIFDPEKVGDRLNYQNSEINDSRFQKTKTISSTWDAQGLTGLREGAVWYRHHFTLPADLKGKPVGLFLGGFEDEARVWINNEYIGSSGQGFSRPAAFDLTGNLKAGQDNVLAIQIIRNSGANEIGLGGLLRPSFLFTGPQLAQRAPKPAENRRILPGGELGEVE